MTGIGGYSADLFIWLFAPLFNFLLMGYMGMGCGMLWCVGRHIWVE
jgi:hypothetical protein